MKPDEISAGILPEKGRLDRRRVRRLKLGLPLVVSGIDAGGDIFSEVTASIDASYKGCCFPLNMELSNDDTIRIRIVRLDTRPHRWFVSTGRVIRTVKEMVVGLSGEVRERRCVAAEFDAEIQRL